jgi:putative transposase
MVRRNFKNRIKPTKIQIQEFESQTEFLRLLYNAALQERRDYYKRFKKGVSYKKQSKYLPEIKQLFAEETVNMYSQVIQESLQRLDLSFKNFFRRVKNGEKSGYPRYKQYNTYSSLIYPQVIPDLSHGCAKLILGKTEGRAKLKLSGFTGEIKVLYHRPIEGICKRVMIKRSSSGKFYVVFCCDKVEPKLYSTTNKTVGIDLGLINFMTFDDGKVIRHPKPYKTSKEKLAYEQRKLSSKKRGSNNRKKQRVRVAKLHERIRNIREDFQHKITTKLVREYDYIIVEDLNIKNMMESKCYEVSKQNIADAAWGGVIQMLDYKAGSAGNKTLTKINPHNTSKTCSNCDNVKEKKLELNEREYCCDKCGLIIDRDLNAAINIKRFGISLFK